MYCVNVSGVCLSITCSGSCPSSISTGDKKWESPVGGDGQERNGGKKETEEGEGEK